MVRAGLLNNNQHENKRCFASETSAEAYIYKLNSSLVNLRPHFTWYEKKPSINELRTFRCDIYPITSLPEKLYDRNKEG